ncbi:MAG: hypothetical protein ABI852_01900 [Gemmatimonadaceae bacterium]
MRIQSVFAVLLLAPAMLAAQGSSSHGADMSAGLRFGTLGFGVEVNKLIVPHLGARVGFNAFSHSTTRDEDDISFDANLKWHSFTALVDVYPGARKSFHLTGGIVTNPLEFTGVGVPKGSSFEIDDVQYTAAQVGTLNGSGEFSSVLPYFGIGFGTPANSHKGVKVVLDVGAAIGQPTLTLTATNPTNNAQLAQHVKNQEIKTQDDVRKYLKVYPSITLGLMFAF